MEKQEARTARKRSWFIQPRVYSRPFVPSVAREQWFPVYVSGWKPENNAMSDVRRKWNEKKGSGKRGKRTG